MVFQQSFYLLTCIYLLFLGGRGCFVLPYIVVGSCSIKLEYFLYALVHAKSNLLGMKNVNIVLVMHYFSCDFKIP